MQSTLKITSRDFLLPDWLEAEVREKTTKLERFHPDIIDCEVAVSAPVGYHERGGPFTVRINLQVKGAELAVSNRSAENLKAALLDAFDAARRQLEDHSHRMQHEMKRHDEPIARVSKIFREGGYGFLRTPEGRELYFHRNAVLGRDFDKLEVGTEIRYDEEMGEAGPQATSVKVIDNYTKSLKKL